MISTILYGKYQFLNNVSFTIGVDYLRLSGVNQEFISNGNHYVAITCEEVGGVAELHYYKSDNTFSVAWDENSDWRNQNFRLLEFQEPLQITEAERSRLEYILLPYTQIIEGYWLFNLHLPLPSASIETYFDTQSSYVWNENTYYSMRYTRILSNAQLYFGDIRMYEYLADEWFNGSEDAKRTIYFSPNSEIDATTYDFITSNATRQYQITFGGFGVYDVVLGTSIVSFPMAEGTQFDYNGKKYRVDGWYYEATYTTQAHINDPITQDTILYLKATRLVKIEKQEYILNALTTTTTYENLSFYVGVNAHLCTKIRVSNSGNDIEVYDYDDGSWQYLKYNGYWQTGFDVNPMNICFIDTYIPITLDIEILSGGGTYAYDLQYITNVEGQSVASKTFIHSITNAELPSISVPTPQELLGWYFDPLFTRKASVGDILTEDTIFYAKVGVPTSINITLYQNKNVNNSLNKTPIQKAVVSGTFKENVSIVSPRVIIEYSKLDFNYLYIDAFQRYYFVKDIIAINSKLLELVLFVDVLMSFRSQLLEISGLVGRNEYEFNNYLRDERDVIEEGCDVTLIDATGGTDISSTNTQASQRGNILLMGVK